MNKKVNIELTTTQDILVIIFGLSFLSGLFFG